MPDVLLLVLLGVVAFAASTVAAVTGFGGAVVLLPVVVAVFGVRDAIPILTVAQLLGNAGRVVTNRREVAWPVVGWYSAGAVPAALVGGVLFAQAPLAALTRLLGVFLLVMVAFWYFRRDRFPRLSRRGFAPLGAASSFLSALVGSSGPVTAPFFVAHGLVKGAYIGTEALAAVVTHTTKLIAYGNTATLSLQSALAGAGLGVVMISGSVVGKKLLDRVSEKVFVLLVQCTLVLAGLVLLFRGR
jgi:uncharacterized membrane protein YfcA